jgi:hypothetical protein
VTLNTIVTSVDHQFTTIDDGCGLRVRSSYPLLQPRKLLSQGAAAKFCKKTGFIRQHWFAIVQIALTGAILIVREITSAAFA